MRFVVRVFLIVLALLHPVALPAEHPNILVLTCDNLGYGDLSCFNPDSELQTPHLNQLAMQGARLTDFYTASPTCTVSRACLLTGRIAQRHGLTEQLAGVTGNYGIGLDQSEQLLPQYLQRSPTPYATGCFGKWNIGFAPGSRPTERGFDEFIGHASGNMDYYRHNYRERHDLYHGIDALHRPGEYATDLFADAAIQFMETHTARNEPWFCYVPFNAPHFPTQGNKRAGQPNVWQAPDSAFHAIGVSPDTTDPRRRYAAVVYQLDAAIGRILDRLRALGQSERTFVFFMSDNGAFRLNRNGLDVGINTPLRSGGVTCWEGGLRVPAITRWPGRIPAGSVIAEPLWSPDLLVACCQLADVPLPASIVLDGRDPLPLLTAGRPTPHRALYFEYRNYTALRSGHWKIIREGKDKPWQLYDLSRDIAESQNLAAAYPEKVEQLLVSVRAWRQSLADGERVAP
jgi:arylsulfatase A